VADQALDLELQQATNAVTVRATPGLDAATVDGGGDAVALAQPGGVRNAQRVEVEEGIPLGGEDVDDLPGAGQPVWD
jgi:hypothetical protein